MEYLRKDIKNGSNIVFVASVFNNVFKSQNNYEKLINWFEKIEIIFNRTYLIDGRISKENAKKYQKWQDFLMASISKTYTKARIQRTCMFILLQITKAQMQENNHFNQVIVSGFDSVGQEFLKGKQVITKFKELPKFLQDIELKCQYLSFV